MDIVKVSRQLENNEITVFDLDLSEIEKVCAMIPKGGVIDMHVAEELATQFIRAADMLSELHLIIMRWEGKAITRKKKAWGEAFYIRATKKGIKTAKEKEAYADSDDEYVLWSDRATEAQAAKKYIEQKYNTLIKAHHLAKSAWEANKDQEKFAGRVSNNFTDNQSDNPEEEEW